MEIIIIGSGTGVPSLRRGSPATVIRVGDHLLLLDSGSGTLRRLLEAGVDFRDVDYLFYSHFHPDHTSDLVPFLFASNYGSEEVRRRGLTIIGPPGMADFYEKLKGMIPAAQAVIKIQRCSQVNFFCYIDEFPALVPGYYKQTVLPGHRSISGGVGNAFDPANHVHVKVSHGVFQGKQWIINI